MNPVISTSIDEQIRNQGREGRVASFLKKFNRQYEQHEALESDKYAVRSAHATLKESVARAVEVLALAHAQLDYLTEPIDVATVLAENFERTNYPFLRLAGQLQPQLLLAQNAAAVLEIVGSRRSKIQDELTAFEKKNREVLAAIAADDADFAEERAADQRAEAERQNEAAARDEEKSERTFTNLPPIVEFSASPE